MRRARDGEVQRSDTVILRRGSRAGSRLLLHRPDCFHGGGPSKGRRVVELSMERADTCLCISDVTVCGRVDEPIRTEDGRRMSLDLIPEGQVSILWLIAQHLIQSTIQN